MPDAITLITNVMDEDLRKALAKDEAFEELDDYFVNQVAEENVRQRDVDDFYYEAHIAKFIYF
ncbi:uncharacterized protein CCR75_006049 [Bremia lactucae]|uniref:Uncharacterized protein n=1 Tax=Bremia lactucae TaxID=4779 RepID=A0A976NYK1_BRELC|nr:hypothetical protein CCR75_006049 [Bremia lactucae]